MVRQQLLGIVAFKVANGSLLERSFDGGLMYLVLKICVWNSILGVQIGRIP